MIQSVDKSHFLYHQLYLVAVLRQESIREPMAGQYPGMDGPIAATAHHRHMSTPPRHAAAHPRPAEASASGSPQISAPARSAPNSRVRLIAICTIIAANGGTIKNDERRNFAGKLDIVLKDESVVHVMMDACGTVGALTVTQLKFWVDVRGASRTHTPRALQPTRHRRLRLSSRSSSRAGLWAWSDDCRAVANSSAGCEGP